MKYSYKFKNVLSDLKHETFNRFLPVSEIYREDHTFRNRFCNCLFNGTSHISSKELYEYSDLRVSYSFYDNQDIYFIIYRNPVTHNYCIILAYRNQKTYYEVFKSFFINDLYFNYDELHSTVSNRHKLYICEDKLEFFKNLRIVL